MSPAFLRLAYDYLIKHLINVSALEAQYIRNIKFFLKQDKPQQSQILYATLLLIFQWCVSNAIKMAELLLWFHTSWLHTTGSEEKKQPWLDVAGMEGKH